MSELSELTHFTNELLVLLTEYGLKLLWAVVILLVGYLIANWSRRGMHRYIDRVPYMDPTLKPLLANLVRAGILVFTLLAVLEQVGVTTTSLIALLGAAGLAVGLALQGTLTNVASGVMLLVFKPFRPGDVIEISGTLAMVDEVGVFVTEMHTLDNIHVVMPNSRIWGNEIKNFTRNDNRRSDLTFGIGYGDSMAKALQLVRQVVLEDSRVLVDPEPLVAISELGDSSVNILARYWTQRSDFLQTRFDLMRKVKERFDSEGITIPFPQRDVHLHSTSPIVGSAH